MAEQKSITHIGGVSFYGLLTLLFVALKLTHVIDWSWWWVLAPYWIPVGFGLVFFLGCMLFWLGVVVYLHLKPRRRRAV